MSTNRLCNNCKSPLNATGRPASDQINYELVVGWFKKLELGVQNDLISELSSKVEGSTSIDHNKLASDESEEEFRLRKLKELFKKLNPSNSQKAFGTKVLKAYVRAHGLSHLSLKRQVHDHEECNNSLNKPELFKVKMKSLDDHLKRGGSQNGQVCVVDQESSLKLELFKIRTLVISGPSGTHGGQGSSADDQQVQQQ